MNTPKHPIRSILLFTLLCAALIGGAWRFLGGAQTSATLALADLALQPGDLSDTGQLLGSAATNADDPSHPLNRQQTIVTDPQDLATLLAYEEAYKTEAVDVDTATQTVRAVVGAYLYRYADDAQTNAAQQILLDRLVQVDQATVLEGTAQTGQKLQLNSGQGTVVNLFVDARDRVLTLLVLEGLPTAETQQLFDQTVSRLQSRRVR
ncbi:MAG: hypothetical protein WAZ19_06165 [Anaerolineae bacterium]